MKKSLLFALTCFCAMPAQASVQDLIDGIKKQDLGTVEKLLQNGEDVNAQNEQGNTPLHYAVALNNADIAELLLGYGADMNIENAKGWSPLKIAQKKDVQQVTDVLIAAAQMQKEGSLQTVQKAVENVAEPVVQEAVVVEKVTTEAKAPAETVSDQALLKKALTALKETQKGKEQAEAAQKQAEEALKEAERKNADLEKSVKELEEKVKEQSDALAATQEKLKVAEQENAALTVAKAEAEKKAAQPAAAPKAEPKKVQPQAKAQPQARAKPQAKVQPKPQAPAKPKPPVRSKLNGALFEGDEEIVYCMNILGHVENPNMVTAAGFYASTAHIAHARYNEITNMANGFMEKADEQALKLHNEQCAKVITPTNAQKQNQIIRSLNQARSL